MTKYRFFEIVKLVMIKKIFIALSLFVPLFCWAENNPSLVLSINNKVNLSLPKEIKEIIVIDTHHFPTEGYTVRTKTNQLIMFNTIYKEQIKKDMESDKTVFNFFNSAYNNPESDVEKMINKRFKQNFISIKKTKDLAIYTYKVGDNIQSMILSPKLKFAVIVSYPLEYKDYLKTLIESKIKQGE